MIRVALVDDEPIVRAGIAMLLDGEDDVTVVGQAGDGREALALADTLEPDVLVMDVRMPDLDGVSATRLLRGGGEADPSSGTRVLVLTTYRIDEAVLEALRAGASGFVLKDAAPAELVLAVRAVAQGRMWLDPSVVGTLVGSLPPPGTDRRALSGRLALLTPRELEVLALIAHGWDNTRIAERLVVSAATVKTHVHNVFHKLGVEDRAKAVAVAFRAGVVTPDDASP